MPKIVVVTDQSLKTNANGQVEINLSSSELNLLYVTGSGELGVNASAGFSKDYFPINVISGTPTDRIGKISCSSAVSRLISTGNSDGDIFNTGSLGNPYNEGVNTVNLMSAILRTPVNINWWSKEEYQKTTNMGVISDA